MARKKAAASEAVAVERVEPLIHEIRGEKVILDSDLARLYGVTTKRLNEQVKRNQERFPDDFIFQLTVKESDALRSQFATSSEPNRSQDAASSKSRSVLRSQNATSTSHGGRRYRPYVFTEHGAIMAANVLNSPRAVQMSVFVVRAFLKMRALLGDKHELAKQLAALEKELKQRLDIHEAAIVTILQRVMDIIDPPAEPPTPEKPKIGFKP
jgi:phage regulator Rha-like protein